MRQLSLLTTELWIEVKDGNDTARDIFKPHYSRRRYRDGRNPKLFVGPGEKVVLITPNADALFVWRKFIDDSGERGVNCAVFRNESRVLSSVLIREAEPFAWKEWPGERLYTYVNPSKIRSTNPGFCFLMAGWSRCGHQTKNGLVILEKLPASFFDLHDGQRVGLDKPGHSTRRVSLTEGDEPMKTVDPETELSDNDIDPDEIEIEEDEVEEEEEETAVVA